MDICIIYARIDASGIPPALETVLEPEWSVWWDRHLVAGDYRTGIEMQIRTCEVLVPVWSAAATFNAHMHDELEIARKAGVDILPVRIHEAEPPMGYGSLQVTEMLGWAGERDRPEISSLVERIRVTIERRRPDERPQRLTMNGPVELPTFFFSVCRFIRILKTAPAANIVDEQCLEIRSSSFYVIEQRAQ